MIYLSFIVLIPLAAVVWASFGEGVGGFLRSISNPQAIAALRLTFEVSAVVVVINIVTGTLIAWVLVRDAFRGKGLVNSLIDLPFALPTVVAGLTLLTLYGPKSPLGLNIAYTKAAIAMALLFVTLPFVVRAVQPVLAEMDREMEEAAHSLGASPARHSVSPAPSASSAPSCSSAATCRTRPRSPPFTSSTRSR
jgi:sulfate transport system permease protein